jgi:hypothetical protein
MKRMWNRIERQILREEGVPPEERLLSAVLVNAGIRLHFEAEDTEKKMQGNLEVIE